MTSPDPVTPERPARVVLELWQSSHGGYQLSISVLDDGGTGHGYRIFGTKFDGGSTLIRRHDLTERDAHEIASYLNRLEADDA